MAKSVLDNQVETWQDQVARYWLHYIQRPVQAFFHMPGSKGFGALLFIFILTIIVAVIDLNVNYVNPDTGQGLDIGAAAYAVFALLVFETPLPLPTFWLTRLVFFAVPITGILVLGQGLIRMGNSLLDVDLWNRAMAATYKDHVIVCGLGRVGLRVIRWILDLGEEVVVIDNRPDNQFVGEIRRWGVPVIIADARRSGALKDAGIEAAESIVPCTSDDLMNLSIALEARQLVPGIKVVLRMFDNHLAANVEKGFDIHTAFSIPDLSAPAFAAAATRAPLDYAFSYDEEEEKSLLTITKFTVVSESSLVGYTIRQLEAEFDVAVIAHRSNGKFQLHPKGDAVLCVGDRFVLSAPIHELNRIAKLTPPTHDMDLYRQGRWPSRYLEGDK